MKGQLTKFDMIMASRNSIFMHNIHHDSIPIFFITEGRKNVQLTIFNSCKSRLQKHYMSVST